MAAVDPTVLEMPTDPAGGLMPYYRHLLDWTAAEVAGLSDAQLDLAEPDGPHEWRWWSIRRLVSHNAWTALVFPHRRCAGLLWPDGVVPEPVVWDEIRLGPGARFDRMLDPVKFPDPASCLEMTAVGLGWLEQVVREQSIEAMRGTIESVRGTHFWAYVIGVLPRGAGPDAERPGSIRYSLEGSLWMVFYELAAHVRTIQRMKALQGLAPVVELPRFGYLRLPEYWGDDDRNGPSFDLL
jgi:hypothetical protein